MLGTLFVHTGLMTMLILTVHNIPEGIATFTGTLANPSFGLGLALAIGLHNIPEGLAVGMCGQVCLSCLERMAAALHSLPFWQACAGWPGVVPSPSTSPVSIERLLCACFRCQGRRLAVENSEIAPDPHSRVLRSDPHSCMFWSELSLPGRLWVLEIRVFARRLETHMLEARGTHAPASP